MATKTFFISSVSSGFGLAVSKEALSTGRRLVRTRRDEQSRADFATLNPGRAFVKVLKATNHASVPFVFAEAEAQRRRRQALAVREAELNKWEGISSSTDLD